MYALHKIYAGVNECAMVIPLEIVLNSAANSHKFVILMHEYHLLILKINKSFFEYSFFYLKNIKEMDKKQKQ